MTLQRLDGALQEVALSLVSAFLNDPWQRLRYMSRWTPAGDVGADDFWLTDRGIERKALPDVAPSLQVSRAAKAHWTLTQELGQPRWYAMTVTVERSGKYAADFEYRDRYAEGDIMQSV